MQQLDRAGVPRGPASDGGDQYVRGMELLVDVVQELSLARTLDQVQHVVRTAARRLTGADGATFVLRDGDMCFYADEDAIAPLWKGSRFPMETCISGWAMLHRRAAVIEDIYSDSRIPHDAYRPTFVKSLAMVPIRTLDPVGAIGNYWAERRLPSGTEVRLLQALADTTAVALDNVRLYEDLEQRVRLRTAELAAANQSLREFVAVAAHDIRGPLSAIRGAAQLLFHPGAAADRELVTIIDRQTYRLDRLVGDLMTLSLYDSGHLETRPQDIELADIVEDAVREVTVPVEIAVPRGLTVVADPTHMQRIIGNFLRNAEKYGAQPITLQAHASTTHVQVQVCDEGPGVPTGFEEKLFSRFSRGPSPSKADGAGLGLSIAQALVRANGGQVFYEPNQPTGACFGVRLPA